ncbi:MAG: hypothetical protein AAB551_01240 [Patescibacteria group bacterium]
MQKSTLFVLILAVLVTLTVTTFLNNDLSNSVTANVLSSDAPAEPSALNDTSTASDVTSLDLPDSATVSDPIFDPSFLTPETNSSAVYGLADSSLSPPTNVSSFLAQRIFLLQKLTPENLNQVGFKNMQLQESPFDQMLFQLLDLSIFKNLSALRMHLTNGKDVFAVLHEFEFDSMAKAVSFYSDIKQKIAAFSPLVTSNETNQFGENSYYMNDKNRPGTAFLVFRVQSHVFAFSYSKASHDFFKSLIFLLAK